MPNYQLVVRSAEGDLISRVFARGQTIEISDETDRLFREALEHLIWTEPWVEYKDAHGRLIRQTLPEEPEALLRSVAEYLRHTLKYDVRVEPVIEVAMVANILARGQGTITGRWPSMVAYRWWGTPWQITVGEEGLPPLPEAVDACPLANAA